MAIYDDEQPHNGSYWNRGEALSPGELKQSEEIANPDTQESEEQVGKPDKRGGDKQGSSPTTPFSKNGKGNLKGAVKSFANRNKKKLIFGGIGGSGLFTVLMILFLLFNLLKIPDFAQNVLSWQFAKVTNEARLSTDNVVDEKLSLDAYDADAIDKSANKYLDEEYGDTETLDTLNGLNLNTIEDNLEGSNFIKTADSGKQIITSPDNDPSNTKTYTLSGNFDQDLSTLQASGSSGIVNDAVNHAVKLTSSDMPTIVRSAATDKIISSLGATLDGLDAGNYTGKDQAAASTEMDQEVFDDVNEIGVDPALTQQAAAEAAVQAEQQVVANPQELEQLVASGNTDGISAPVETTLDNSFPIATSTSLVSQALGKVTLNGLYNVVVLGCAFYDGLQITPQSINSQEQSTTREAALVLSTADQQKDGTSFSSAAAGALSNKLGNIQQSNAMERVSGQSPNTLAGIGGQRSVLGTYVSNGANLFSLIFGANQTVSGVLRYGAQETCSNVGLTGIVIGGANVLAIVGPSFLSGFTSEPEEIAGEEAAQAGIVQAAANFAKTAFGNLGDIGSSVLDGGKQFLKLGTQYALAYYAGTALKLTVESRSGLMTSGLESGKNFDNNVDSGANQLAGEVSRQEYYGRPLTNTEAAQSQQAGTQAEVAYDNKSLNAFDRYLSPDNPNSLVTKTSIATATLFSRNTFVSLMGNLADVFNPNDLLNKLFATLDNKVALADSAQDTQDYGNVQFGYSPQEQQLMQQPSYAPLQNEQILNQHGQAVAAIAAQYGQCFTETMGDMLAGNPNSPDLTRDNNGNPDGGLCSPNNLQGVNSPGNLNLVFRWRLEHNYQNTENNLMDIQNANAST